MGFISTEGTERKPKWAIVADFVGSDKALIHKELSEFLALRYLDAPNKFDGLPNFNSTGGRILLWADHSPHAWEQSIRAKGIFPKIFHGTLHQLVEFLKHELQVKKGLA